MIEPQEVPPDRETSAPDVSLSASPVTSDRASLYADVDQDELNKKLFAMARAAVTHAQSSDLSKKRSAMSRSYRAYANEHAEGSKYRHKNYSSRSKLHVPKTRSAVKNKMVAAHAALFGTDDVVAISAEDDSDPAQQASAELNKHLLNYRLDRTSHRAGIPWFRIAMGAALDAAVAGICLTKQYWQFKEVLKEISEDEAAEIDPNDPGSAGKDIDQTVVGMNGRPMRRKVQRDRPMIEPHAPENVIVDMAAPWWDVVQEGAFFIVKIPMHVGDVRSMMKPGAQHMGGGPWFQIPEKVMASAVNDVSGTSVRTARNQGTDRYSRTSNPAVNDFDIVWVHENFVRLNDCDYHFWTLGTKQLLSEPGETGTKGHYPAHHGERPYVMGVGSIEPHTAIPMSHVESWRPLQDEINDTTNLYLDAMKQNISPIAVYRRGANVDLRAVRERGPDATIQVSNLENDIKFDRAGGADPAAMDMVDRQNSQFDELAGSFAQSTVQSSRSIGETVGGMNLYSNAAASVQEFDLQVFLQTWAEPTLRHVVWLEQWYETDETLMALMGKKADLYQRFGGAFVDPQTGQPVVNPKTGQPIELGDLLEREITVKVNMGPGAGDPNQKMGRLGAAFQMMLQIAPMFGDQVKPKGEEITKEIFSSTGVSAERLFTFLSLEEADQAAAEQPPDPAVEVENKKLELTAQKQESDTQLAQEKNAVERERLQMEREKIGAERETASKQLVLKGAETHAKLASQAQDMALQRHDSEMSGLSQVHDMHHRNQEAEHARETGQQDMRLRAFDSAAKLPNPEAEAQQQEAKASESNAIGQGLDKIGEALQMLAKGQQQQGEAIMALLSAQESKQRMVQDGMGRSIPVETR